MIVGTGDFQYRVIDDWGRGPEGREFGVVAGLAVDAQDRIYVGSRKPVPCILVYSSDGRFLTSWGEGVFTVVGGVHGLFISEEGHIYCGDALDHTIRKFTLDGELLMTLGIPGQPGEPEMPFNMPTKAVLSPSGEIFVSDGYGQARVHRFSPNGELLGSWGSEGTGPGQFNTVHGIAVDKRGRVLVADRGNSRVQVFDAEGVFLEEWPMSSPNDVYIDKHDNVYASDGIFNLAGERLARIEEMMGHNICVDSHDNIYWATVGITDPERGFIETANLVKKFERV